jgi:phytoene dehydrogenase-like protein
MGTTEIKRSQYDVIVVGAGIGGLTCGASLAKGGKRVLVCEQHFLPGGYVTSFKRKGFTFDGGLQSFGSNGIVFPILKELGLWSKVKFARADYQLITPDLNFKLNSFEQIASELVRVFSKDGSGISGYFNEIENLAKPLKKMYGGTVPLLLRGWRKSIRMFLFLFSNFGFLRNLRKYRKVTSIDLIDKHITDRKVKFTLSSLGYPVMGAVATAGMWYSWTEDYWYPVGGMQKFANVFVNFIEKNGGDVSLKTKVDKIIVRNGKAVGVRLEDGREIHSKFVVSNADYRQTFTKLIDSEHLDKEFIKKVKKAKASESLFCVYLGTNLDRNSLKELAHHVFYFPNYDKSFLGKDANDPDFFKDCGMVISVPSLADDSLAPKGKSVITLTSFAPYNYLNKWRTKNGKRTEEYKKLKQKIANQLIATAERVIPGLSKHIIVKEISTPLTHERYTSNSEGASAGWSWNPKYGFTKQFTASVKTPIKNLFTAGHWSLSPGGLPSAMLTGKIVANTILKKN